VYFEVKDTSCVASYMSNRHRQESIPPSYSPCFLSFSQASNHVMLCYVSYSEINTPSCSPCLLSISQASNHVMLCYVSSSYDTSSGINTPKQLTNVFFLSLKLLTMLCYVSSSYDTSSGINTPSNSPQATHQCLLSISQASNHVMLCYVSSSYDTSSGINTPKQLTNVFCLSLKLLTNR
jgi:hypothetical protein